MQGHRRRRATQKLPATPISPEGGGGTASISLSLLRHDVTDIALSSLRELDAVALATNSIISMKRGTKEAGGTRLRVAQRSRRGQIRRRSRYRCEKSGLASVTVVV